MKKIVVVGGGQAGYSASAKLRSLGFDGEITLICGENELPYQRPPLSKKYLLGGFERERLFLRPESFYQEQDISLRLGEWCEAINLEKKVLKLTQGDAAFDAMLLTTGALPRYLPAKIGGNLAGVYAVRDLADIDKISAELDRCERAVVIGGGYIGLEAAASLNIKGLHVTVVEMAPRILQRVAAAETSYHLRKLHQARGTLVIEEATTEGLIGNDAGRVQATKLADGRHLDADLVIVGIGIVPNTQLAEQAGLEINNGIKVDRHCRTSHEAVFAAGDCASFPYREGRRIRLENVQNAIDQAECAATNAIGRTAEYAPTPWFWSDQYDTRLQIAGLGSGYDRIVTRKGSGKGAVSHWYFHQDEFLAVDAINDARSYMVGKKLLESGKSPTADAVTDPHTDLKSLLK